MNGYQDKLGTNRKELLKAGLTRKSIWNQSF